MVYFIDLVRQFFMDSRTMYLLALIGIDLVTGIIAALRTRAFAFSKLGDFYYSNILPYVLGYLLIYIISLLGIANVLGDLWGQLVASVGLGPALISLIASVGDNLHRIQVGAPPNEPRQG